MNCVLSPSLNYGVRMVWSVTYRFHSRSVRDTGSLSFWVITIADCEMRFFALKPSKSPLDDRLRRSSLFVSLPLPSFSPLSLSPSMASYLPPPMSLKVVLLVASDDNKIAKFSFIKLQASSGTLGMESHIAVYLILDLMLTSLGNLISPISNGHQTLWIISYEKWTHIWS